MAAEVASEVATLFCRLCAESCSKDFDHSIEDPEIRSKIDTVFNFEVSNEEHLPKRVCQECLSRISTWFPYHETVRSNQNRLMSLATTEEKHSIPTVEYVKIEMDEEHYCAEETADVELDIKKEEHDQLKPYETLEEPVQKDPKRVNTTVKRKCTERSSLEKMKPKATKQKAEQMEADNKKIQDFFKLICEICSESFETFHRYQIHTQRVHNTRASIKCCDRVMYKKYKIIDHIDSHLNPDRFHCSLCNRYYQGRYHLEQHNLLRHSNDKKPFKCDKCKQSFPKEYQLKSHLLAHVQHKCLVCQKMLANLQTLRTHMTLMHGDGDKQQRIKLICETCGEEYNNKQAMDQHVKKHQGLKSVKRVQCPICSKWLSRKSALNIHIKMLHNQEDQRIACDVCDRVYPNHQAMSNHKRRVHIEEKFECEFCGKKFKLKISLKEHRASHTGETLYSCDVCGITSNSNANLYTHKRNKHPELKKAKQTASQLN